MQRSASTSLNSLAPSHRAVTPKGSNLSTQKLVARFERGLRDLDRGFA
jgi:hypothetical protein